MDIVFTTIQSCLIKVIQCYQRLISPWLAPCCRYHPTCSEYAVICLKEQALHKAICAIVWRILSCNPFARGGVDMPCTRLKQARSST